MRLHTAVKRPIVRIRVRSMGDAACGADSFQDPQAPWLTDGSGNASSTPHCVLNQFSRKVYEQLGVPTDIASNLPPGFDPRVPAVPGSVSLAQWWSDPAGVGGCPVISLEANTCGGVNPSTGDFIITGCDNYRECDPLTGVVHAEAPLPGGPTGNVGFGAPSQGNVPPATTTSTIQQVFQNLTTPLVPAVVLPIRAPAQPPPATPPTTAAAPAAAAPAPVVTPTAPTSPAATQASSQPVPVPAAAASPASVITNLTQSAPTWLLIGGAVAVILLVVHR